ALAAVVEPHLEPAAMEAPALPANSGLSIAPPASSEPSPAPTAPPKPPAVSAYSDGRSDIDTQFANLFEESTGRPGASAPKQESRPEAVQNGAPAVSPAPAAEEPDVDAQFESLFQESKTAVLPDEPAATSHEPLVAHIAATAGQQAPSLAAAEPEPAL